MFKSTGKIITNPKSKSTKLGEWWVIVDVCPEIGRYYQSITKFLLRYSCNVDIQTPSWGYHISIVRGEKICTEFTDKYININGNDVEFEYSSNICTNGRYIWIPVYSNNFFDIRESLGIKRKPDYDFHLTIGVNIKVSEKEQKNTIWSIKGD